MNNFMLKLDFKFLDDEKHNCISTAIRIVKLSNVAENYGILALQNEIINDEKFIELGINLMLNGVNSEAIEIVYENLILSEDIASSELLDMLIIYQGILAISKGYNSYVVSNIVGSILGCNYLSQILLEREKYIELTINNIIDKYSSYIQSSYQFQEKLSNISESDLRIVLIDIDDEIIATAFLGCDKDFIIKKRYCFSETTFMRICLLFESLTLDKNSILNCQEHILNKLYILMGNI